MILWEVKLVIPLANSSAEAESSGMASLECLVFGRLVGPGGLAGMAHLHPTWSPGDQLKLPPVPVSGQQRQPASCASACQTSAFVMLAGVLLAKASLLAKPE